MMSRAKSLRGLRRWREIGIVFFGAGVALWLAAERSALHEPARVAYAVLSFLGLGVALAVWIHLYLFAVRSGGHVYALGQTLLSIVLTPVAYLGVMVVPLLVESDVRKGVARWRRATALTLRERILCVVTFCVLWFLCSLIWSTAFAFLASAGIHLVGMPLLARRVRTN